MHRTFRLPWAPNPAPAYLTPDTRAKIEALHQDSLTDSTTTLADLASRTAAREAEARADSTTTLADLASRTAALEAEARDLVTADRVAWTEQSARRQREAKQHEAVGMACTWELALRTLDPITGSIDHTLGYEYYLSAHADNFEAAQAAIEATFRDKLGTMNPGAAVIAMRFRGAYLRRDGKLTAEIPMQDVPYDKALRPSQVDGTVSIVLGLAPLRNDPPPFSWSGQAHTWSVPRSPEETAAFQANFREQLKQFKFKTQ